MIKEISIEPPTECLVEKDADGNQIFLRFDGYVDGNSHSSIEQWSIIRRSPGGGSGEIRLGGIITTVSYAS